jgi:hypothetical protein
MQRVQEIKKGEAMKSALLKRYKVYAKRHPKPLRFSTWLFFHKAGKLAKGDKSAAGRAGALARWGGSR